MLTVLRAFLIIAAPITALFVSRDAINFGVIETLVAVILIAAFCLAVAFWRLRPPDRHSKPAQDQAARRISRG